MEIPPYFEIPPYIEMPPDIGILPYIEIPPYIGIPSYIEIPPYIGVPPYIGIPPYWGTPTAPTVFCMYGSHKSRRIVEIADQMRAELQGLGLACFGRSGGGAGYDGALPTICFGAAGGRTRLR